MNYRVYEEMMNCGNISYDKLIEIIKRINNEEKERAKREREERRKLRAANYSNE